MRQIIAFSRKSKSGKMPAGIRQVPKEDEAKNGSAAGLSDIGESSSLEGMVWKSSMPLVLEAVEKGHR